MTPEQIAQGKGAFDSPAPSNAMRPAYRTLSHAEKENIEQVKSAGAAYHDFIASLGNSREISLAKTKIEEAVMWAVKHITA